MIEGIFTKILRKILISFQILEIWLDGPMHTEYETLKDISQTNFSIEKNAQTPHACFISWWK